ncbi:MAG TPA: ABC transporter permease [Cyclobacteriaceae bacterium]|nr:ABC transporter permease [Cyclobacteriaceae bacterium]
MLLNYLTIARRNLLKNKAYSFINIAGLSIGLACALAIGLFIADEYSYDRFHKNAANIYRVVQYQVQAGDTYTVAVSAGPMADALKADFPEVKAAARMGHLRTNTLKYENTVVESSKITMADPDLLKVFDFELVAGNSEKLFTAPDQIVITDKMASTLSVDITKLVGSIITYDKTRPLIVTGIIKNPPVNSHIQFDAILSYDPADDNNKWNSNNYHTYVLLAEDADPAAMDAKLHDYIRKYRDPASTFAPPVYYLQPLTDIYLHSKFDFETDWTKTSSIVYVRVFIAVGVVVLIIAVFNFINLSTARAVRRAKEVGIRKTIGAYYRQLMTQFLSESFMITVISVVVAVVLMNFGLQFLNDLSGKDLAIPFTAPEFIAALVSFTIVVSILAGLYPSVYLSNFQPAKVLKGVFDVRSGRRFRQVLVIVQFTLTVVLVAGAIVIYKQLEFLREKNLGFDKSQLIYVKTKGLSRENKTLLRQDLERQSSIAAASLTSTNMIDVTNSTGMIDWEGRTAGDEYIMTQLNVEQSYLATMGITLVAGRNFDGSVTDRESYIINETAAKRMGWTSEEALGKSFKIWDLPGHVIGVMQDFHFRPMTTAIEPMLFMSNPQASWYNGVVVKANANQVSDALGAIETLYKKYDPETPADYTFVDQDLEKQYQFEHRVGNIVLLFSILAIVVACLGLYGLATFTTERRTKEIAVRKVLGASVVNVSALLSRDFILLVAISNVIALPTGYLLASRWLESFVYRIDADWKFLLSAGVFALLIAFITVLFQAVSAARTNTVKSLRSE